VALRDLHRSLLALPAGDAVEAAEASRLAAVVARLRDREYAAAPAASVCRCMRSTSTQTA